MILVAKMPKIQIYFFSLVWLLFAQSLNQSVMTNFFFLMTLTNHNDCKKVFLEAYLHDLVIFAWFINWISMAINNFMV